MNVVKKRSDVVENLIKFEKLLSSKKSDEKDFAANLVLNDPLIVIYKVHGENHFGPASFFGIKKSSIAEYNDLEGSGMKDIKKAITDVVGTPFVNDTTLEKFQEYASELSKKVPKLDRSFWRVKDERGKNLNLTEKDVGKK